MIEIFILAFALSMDAFAVSIGLGVKQKSSYGTLAFKAAAFFGIFQALMPFIGYVGGIGLAHYIQGYDAIIAFILLCFIGAKMIYEAFGENIEEELALISNKVLLMLAIATSIDAMAAGFSIQLLDVNIYFALLIIGLVTFFMSLLGVYIGQKGGTWLESKAEILGGVVLIIIAFKILLF